MMYIIIGLVYLVEAITKWLHPFLHLKRLAHAVQRVEKFLPLTIAAVYITAGLVEGWPDTPSLPHPIIQMADLLPF